MVPGKSKSQPVGKKPPTLIRLAFEHPMITLLLLLIIAPLILPSWSMATMIIIFGLFALAFNLLMQTGLLSFGHGLYFAMGGYGAAMLLVRPFGARIAPDWMAWIALFITGPLLALAVAIPTGILSLRRRGTYFALITVAFCMMFYWTFMQNPFNLTGGDDGLMSIPTPPVFGIGARWRTRVTWYYFCMVIVIICIYALRRLSTSPFGEILKGIRDNDERVRLLGYDTNKYKLLSFILSGLFSGMAGSLFAFELNYIGVDTLYWFFSGEVVLMTLLGGMGTFFGPLVGSYVYILLKDVISTYTEHWMIFMGVIVMALVAGGKGIGVLEIVEKIFKRYYG